MTDHRTVEEREERLSELLPLPFVKESDDGGLCWWSVKPTGQAMDDLELGEFFADVALAVVREAQEPMLLSIVIRDMIQAGRFSEVEAGFVVRIASAARAGAMN